MNNEALINELQLEIDELRIKYVNFEGNDIEQYACLKLIETISSILVRVKQLSGETRKDFREELIDFLDSIIEEKTLFYIHPKYKEKALEIKKLINS